MNGRKLSVNKACLFLAVLLLVAMGTVSAALYGLTQNITAVWYVVLFGIFVLLCAVCFMVLVRRKLAMFSDSFCSLIDNMLSGNMQPKQIIEEESLFYKIEYRLNRLYEVMQENKNSIAQERADLQELISDISHQVKTPIANLKVINSTLLENEIPVQKQKEFLTAQATQLDKLDFLMQAMIKTSRLETGVISLEKKSQPLYDTLAAALGGILLNAEKKQINVQVDCPENLVVSHDRKWTGEALFNILDNAVKYTPEGGTVGLRVREVPSFAKDKGQYEFIVTDNGIGMSEDFIPHIFEPFSRAEESRTNQIQGTGLGMAITQNIVRMMNGTIEVKSALGTGSQFIVAVPFDLCLEAEENNEELSGLPVLVVDDDRIICESAAEILDELGMRSNWVLSGKEAVRCVVDAHEAKDDYFSVILDWKMPEMDGLQTLKVIRKKLGMDVPIIIISAYDYSDIEAEFKNAGADAFITKPLFKSKISRTFHQLSLIHI